MHYLSTTNVRKPIQVCILHTKLYLFGNVLNCVSNFLLLNLHSLLEKVQNCGDVCKKDKKNVRIMSRSSHRYPNNPYTRVNKTIARCAYMHLRMNSETFGNVHNVTNNRTNKIIAFECLIIKQFSTMIFIIHSLITLQ